MTERLIIAGGGLSGVLTAMAFARARPDIALTVIEAGDRLGGDHTWSFYATDLEASAAALVEPFIAHRWDSYETRFRRFSRTFSTGYRSVTSARLHSVAMEALGSRVRLCAKVAGIDGTGVTLADGTHLEADAVIDARGARRLDGVVLRWQKFLGREVRLTEPHGLTHPTIMDANVPQVDGYRFVYLLPFTADTLLIEDTYYSEGAAVDAAALRSRIDDYAAAQGWTIAETIREERGALPLLLSGDFPVMWKGAAPAGGPVPLGLRAGLFHPVTGYSLPASARTAVALADLAGPLSTDRLRSAVQTIARKHFARSSFDRLLNRLLFLAGEPQDRHLVLERFHKLPQPLIERFYAGRLPRAYQLRILVGKPPVPFFRAVRVVPESAALQPR
ncbi:lycopene beta-cyclase CrtY [Acuticoccus sp. MNP-M23]|uniref:lycopene beta-cyclase CrtY n=1 Tax=Acuticoccus sp. MNP-M23 TaxID=3072793 RepID=UPI002816983B|nr:lycopene beta-cyclase CrtY [Acuticoccus sp. MNP-M23]WMS43369.1 lycopene beta-cyclase CrtY [Acuticoccus sp. MNP-M23]